MDQTRRDDGAARLDSPVTPEALPPTADADEIAKFSALADKWHDPHGPFKPLHVFNPSRIAYIRDMASAHLGAPAAGPEPFAGLNIADIGCGGGLISAPMRRLGANVTAIDMAEKNIGAARAYAKAHNLEIDYRAGDSGALTKESPETFDIVLCLEVIEHVADPALLVRDLAALAKPGGIVMLATLNRTPSSFVKAIIGAEYVLRWLPRGTHSWKKFVTPYEMTAMCEQAGLSVKDITGFTFSLLKNTWSRGEDVSVNYALTAVKPAVES